jgi:hypothetical protein
MAQQSLFRVVTPTLSLHSYRFFASTGYNGNAGGCVPDDYGEEEISVDVLIEEQRSLAHSKNPFERVVGTLCVAGLLKQRLAALPDVALGQLMSRYVLDGLNVFSPETTICEIATERLIESTIAIVPKAAKAEKYETSLICPECGAELRRAYE